MLSSSMLLLNLILLIDVTFSTPTPGNNNQPDPHLFIVDGELDTGVNEEPFIFQFGRELHESFRTGNGVYRGRRGRRSVAIHCARKGLYDQIGTAQYPVRLLSIRKLFANVRCSVQIGCEP
jgi:hypothetical protein